MTVCQRLKLSIIIPLTPNTTNLGLANHIILIKKKCNRIFW